MQQSKLLEFLGSFTSRQLSRFREFLESPYFNKTKELVAFFDYLLPYAPGFSDASLHKQHFLQGYPGPKKLTEKRLAYLMNQLLGLAETFVALENYRNDPLNEAFSLLSGISPAVLPRHFKNAQEKAAQALENFPFRNAGYYAELYRFKSLRYWRSSLNQHQHNENLQESADALDEFYLVERLRHSLAMTDAENTLNIKYRWGLSQWLLPTIETAGYPLNPIAHIYLTAIRMAQQPEDTNYFFQFKALLQEHDLRFNQYEQKFLYISLLNYCTRRINRFNDTAFSGQYLEINRTMLERGLLFEEGVLSPWHFINSVNTALRAGEQDWALEFIQRYHKHLPDEYREDIFLTAMGQYHYHQGQYAQAQIALNQTNPRDLLLAVVVRNLLARIYYETGETELLLSFLEAYRVYLLRQEMLTAQMKKQARRFVDFTRRLAKIDRPEGHLLPKLRAELPPPAEIYHRDWLQQQIERKMEQFGLHS